MLLLLLACVAPASTLPEPAPVQALSAAEAASEASASAGAADAKVRAYAGDVARICAEREPEVMAAAMRVCGYPGVGSQMVYAMVDSYSQSSRLIDPQEQRNPPPERICEDAEQAPVLLAPATAGAEPEFLPDPALQAIGDAAIAEQAAKAIYDAQPDASTRSAWTEALGTLQFACVGIAL